MPPADAREELVAARPRSPREIARYLALALLFLLGIAAVIAFAVVAYKWSPGEVAKDVSKAAGGATDNLVKNAGRVASGLERRIAQIAEAFRSENIQHTFSNYLTTIEAEQKARLLVAAVQSEERMTTTSTRPWGTTTVSVTVPATFRYAVSLKEPWKIRTEVTRDHAVCEAVCPPIRPVLPVAFDTRRKEVKVETTWLRRDGEEQAAELEREITPTLQRRSFEHAPQAREAARQAIADFVRGWLAGQGQWGEGKFQQIIVRFPDEAGAAGQPLPAPRRG